MRRIRSGRWGLAEDPRGLRVVLPRTGDEDLHGVVEAIERDDVVGFFRLKIVGEDGEPWPLKPVVSAVFVVDDVVSEKGE